MSVLVADGITLLTQPVNLLILEVLVSAPAYFTKPTSPLRYAVAVLASTLAISACWIIHDRMQGIAQKAGITTSAIGTALTLVDRLLIARYSFEAGGPEAQSHKHSNGGYQKETQKTVESNKPNSIKSPFFFPLEPIYNPRGIRKPWQVKNVPAFSTKDRAYVPSRGRFLLRSFVLAVFWLAIRDASVPQPVAPYHAIAPNKERLLSRIWEVTPEELFLRFVIVVFLFFETMAQLALTAHVLSFVTVALGVHEPADWPPMFDSLGEAYSVRQFWGVFWHQNFRATFEGISNMVTFSWLRLKKGTIIARYTNIVIAFLVSGMLHTAVDYGATVWPSESGSLRFFLMQAFAIMVEDTFQAIYYSISGKRRAEKAPLSHKIFGYLWLIIFLTWSGPGFGYPLIRRFKTYPDQVYLFQFHENL